MKPARFSYLVPETLDDVIATLSEHGNDARLLAGGQSLLPMLNMRLLEPRYLVDINHVQGLDAIAIENGSVQIPALVRQSAVEDNADLALLLPIVRNTLQLVGHRVTRNRGTFVGSTVHADPSAEIPALLTALRAEVVLAGPNGLRRMGIEEFVLGAFHTARRSDEVCIRVEIPHTAPSRAAIWEISRRHGDYAMCGAVGVRWSDSGGTTFVFFGLSSTVIRLDSGSRRRDIVPMLSALLADDDLEINEDIHADAAYRRKLAIACANRLIKDLEIPD